MTEELVLAPGAGSGFGKLVADELLKREGFAKKLADALENGLVAVRRTWDSGLKQWIEEPDTRSQLQAAFGIMAHMEGEPVKRIIHQHLGGEGKIDVDKAVQDSPELAAAVERVLQKSKWKHSGHQSHKKPKPVAKQPAELVD